MLGRDHVNGNTTQREFHPMRPYLVERYSIDGPQNVAQARTGSEKGLRHPAQAKLGRGTPFMLTSQPFRWATRDSVMKLYLGQG
jgi:hypothetical protein